MSCEKCEKEFDDNDLERCRCGSFSCKDCIIPCPGCDEFICDCCEGHDNYILCDICQNKLCMHCDNTENYYCKIHKEDK